MVHKDCDEHLATGRTAYKLTEQQERRRQQLLEIKELERDLGRKLSPDEIDLMFGKKESPTRVRVEGDYGQQDGDEEVFETRRVERGPTSRRFG